VIPAAFEYFRAQSTDEALRQLQKYGSDARVLAGGQSLVPAMRFRLARPAVLVDINRVEGLDAIAAENGSVRIGALARQRAAELSDLVRAEAPLLAEAGAHVAHPSVRRRGTVVGSVAFADPSAELPAALLALDGEVPARSAHGTRTIAASEFFVDSFTTAIEPAEVLTEIRVPIPGQRSGGAYRKLERRAGDFATVGAAVQLTLDDQGKVDRIGIGLTAVAEQPFEAIAAEAEIRGGTPSDALFRQAAAAAAEESRPVADSHGPVDYKLGMVREMTIRALRRAVERAIGS